MAVSAIHKVKHEVHGWDANKAWGKAECFIGIKAYAVWHQGILIVIKACCLASRDTYWHQGMLFGIKACFTGIKAYLLASRHMLFGIKAYLLASKHAVWHQGMLYWHQGILIGIKAYLLASRHAVWHQGSVPSASFGVQQELGHALTVSKNLPMNA